MQSLGRRTRLATNPWLSALHKRIARAEPERDSSSDDDVSGSEAPESSRPSSAGGLAHSASDADLQPPPGVSWKRSKSKRKLAEKKKKDVDYYALLGLQNERWTATDAQIKLGARGANASQWGRTGWHEGPGYLLNALRICACGGAHQRWVLGVACRLAPSAARRNLNPRPVPPCHALSAYRKTALEAHPDKALAGVEDPEEKTRIEDRFKQIQVGGRDGDEGRSRVAGQQAGTKHYRVERL